MPYLTSKRDIRRILLVRPSLTIEPGEAKSLVCPLGLGYLAAVLEKDYEVKVLDALAEGFNNVVTKDKFITYGLSPTEIKERIRDFRPDIVGVSCLFSMQFYHALSVCRVAKEVNPSIVTVMGGAHPSSLPRETLENPEIDFVIIGEAEESIVHLINALKEGSGFTPINGLAYKEQGRIVVNPKTKFIQDLDSIPFPARHLLPMDKYFKADLPHGLDSRYRLNTNIVTSRGCPASCVFCSINSVWGRIYRVRSAGNVLEEIELLKRNYGIREIQFEDDNLTLDRARAVELFQGMVDRKAGVVWSAPNGIAAWALDEELLRLMRKSGCYWLSVAIESGSQEVLSRIIKKPLRLEKVKPLIKEMVRLGMRVTTFFVVGFPGESIAQIKETIKFGLSLPCEHLSIFFATPYPGTELYKICKDRGLLADDYNFLNFRTSRVNILPEGGDAGQLQKLVARAVIIFFFRECSRRPLVILARWWLRLFKDPGYHFSRLAKVIRDSLFLS
jgi:magnesium-protoporphyrin IX monomethyl ester (oxidative) cyclase